MIKRIRFIFVLLLLNTSVYAQNQFVYIRYTPKSGKVSPIVKAVDSLMEKSHGKVVVFVSQALTPLIAHDDSDWNKIRNELLSIQVDYGYYAEEESEALNSFFTKFFNENVDKDLHLFGKEDDKWNCTFIISNDMIKSGEFESLAKVITVNELTKRMPVTVLTYNKSDDQLVKAPLEYNTMYKFNISE